MPAGDHTRAGPCQHELAARDRATKSLRCITQDQRFIRKATREHRCGIHKIMCRIAHEIEPKLRSLWGGSFVEKSQGSVMGSLDSLPPHRKNSTESSLSTFDPLPVTKLRIT